MICVKFKYVNRNVLWFCICTAYSQSWQVMMQCLFECIRSENPEIWGCHTNCPTVQDVLHYLHEYLTIEWELHDCVELGAVCFLPFVFTMTYGNGPCICFWQWGDRLHPAFLSLHFYDCIWLTLNKITLSFTSVTLKSTFDQNKAR